MKQPPGFEVSPNNTVCLLKRAIYGLRQSGREWFLKIHAVLEELGFRKYKWCNCTYNYIDKVILLLYVDDIVIFGVSYTWVYKIIRMLKSKFDLKILGRTKKLLGVNFEDEDGKIYINQSNYISKVCKDYEKFNYPLSTLPIAKGIVYSKTQCPKMHDEIEEMKTFPYRNLIGSLAFIAGRTRPDISYAVNIFSQFQEQPGIVHWNGLMRLLGYLKATQNLKLNLSDINNFNLLAYTDADFASNRDDRTSMGGFIIFLDKVPVTWRTFKEKAVALSTMESEFVALTETSKELIWYARILDECISAGIICKTSFIREIFCDNISAINFSRSPMENHRSKHIDVKLHFIRNLIEDDAFKLSYINSKRNIADVFTKPQTKDSLKSVIDRIFLSNTCET